jgi:hypothetical protein
MRKRLLSMSLLIVKKTKTHEIHSRNSPLSQRIYYPKGADDSSMTRRRPRHREGGSSELLMREELVGLP